MAKALGIGGIFFRSINPEGLANWYRTWLKFPGDSGSYSSFLPTTIPEKGFSVWSPFKKDSDYFGNPNQVFMVNLMVDDLDGTLKQVAEGGAEVIPETEEYDYGRFGWFVDPDGNRVELWQPADASEQ
ncbi:MAG: VOC family protein [Verrucomicrobia bacterium]|nr:VOC family protein [Verrucomicrobiota bacterium]